jgi:hypothetical protein
MGSSRTSGVAAVALAPVLARAAAACGHGAPRVPGDLAERGLFRIPLATGDAHGLSGLTVADDGALWTIAERSRAAFRIELDVASTPPRVRSLRRWPVVGLPRGAELESIGTLPGGAFLVGTEGGKGVHAFRLEPAGERLEVRGEPLALGARELGVRAGGNHGLEGACAVPGLTVLAVEATGSDRAGRWAPVITIADGGAPVVHRLRLTSGSGKLSALDCWRDGDRVRVLALERHFEVTRILAFELSAADDDDGGPRGGSAITPTLVRDLEPVLHGALNLEGLVRLPDGHLLAVVDNQYGGLSGPDELVWLADLPRW